MERIALRIVAVAALVAGLLIAGCNKSSAPQNGESAQQSAPAPESSNVEQSAEGEGPALNDSLDGTPAMMNEDAFLSAYRNLDGVTALPDGVMYRVLKSGSGKTPKASDKVQVHYKGTLMDGTVFDETKGDETAEFPVGKVIKGWQEVLQLMKEGDKWEVVIPSELAYGEKGAGEGQIPPNSPLVFEIELVKVL